MATALVRLVYAIWRVRKAEDRRGSEGGGQPTISVPANIRDAKS